MIPSFVFFLVGALLLYACVCKTSWCIITWWTVLPDESQKTKIDSFFLFISSLRNWKCCCCCCSSLFSLAKLYLCSPYSLQMVLQRRQRRVWMAERESRESPNKSKRPTTAATTADSNKVNNFLTFLLENSKRNAAQKGCCGGPQQPTPKWVGMIVLHHRLVLIALDFLNQI